MWSLAVVPDVSPLAVLGVPTIYGGYRLMRYWLRLRFLRHVFDQTRNIAVLDHLPGDAPPWQLPRGRSGA